MFGHLPHAEDPLSILRGGGDLKRVPGRNNDVPSSHGFGLGDSACASRRAVVTALCEKAMWGQG